MKSSNKRKCKGCKQVKKIIAKGYCWDCIPEIKIPNKREIRHKHDFTYAIIQVVEPDNNGGMPLYREVCKCEERGASTL